MESFGLILSDPTRNPSAREAVRGLLDAQTIPFEFEGFTEQPSPIPTGLPRADFLRQASAALLRPGTPLPMTEVARHLGKHDALPGNVLRRYVCLQLSLMPFLAQNAQVTAVEGGFLLGNRLLILPVSADDTVDAPLPDGCWTDLLTGDTFCRPRLRLMRGYNAMPVLVRPGTLLPVGVDDRHVRYDYADRVTLHWFEPDGSAEITLPGGETYRAETHDGQPHITTSTDKPYHLILHRGGCETLVC